jgi:hypothetical protein
MPAQGEGCPAEFQSLSSQPSGVFQQVDQQNKSNDKKRKPL